MFLLILKNIPISVNKRLSELSSSEDMFKQSTSQYQEALNKSGYKHKLKFNPPREKVRRQRSRKVVYYNPPYSQNVLTNIGKEFFKLIDQHFPVGHILHPIINRNSVKLSYSCLPNVEKIISNHNNKILKDEEEQGQCNCVPDTCPVQGECQTSGLVYRATVTTGENTTFKYVGLTEGTFKERHRKHLSNFRTRNRNNRS